MVGVRGWKEVSLVEVIILRVKKPTRVTIYLKKSSSIVQFNCQFNCRSQLHNKRNLNNQNPNKIQPNQNQHPTPTTLHNRLPNRNPPSIFFINVLIEVVEHGEGE